MRKFIVPQFIDIENKIFGPITVRQFATIAVAAGFLFVAYKLSDFTLFLIWVAVIGILTFVVGFLKINGLPFHIFVISFVGSLKKPALRVWHKEDVRVSRSSILRRKKEQTEQRVFVPKKTLSQATLTELALIIDTGGIYKGEAEANRINKSLYQKA